MLQHLRLHAACLVAFVLIPPLSLRAGDVEGTVLLPERGGRGPRVVELYPGGTPAPDEDPQGPAVIFIDGVKADPPFVPSKEPSSLAQQNRRFLPLALPILVGTTVDFPNRDDEFHNVFSLSKVKELELGRYFKDESRQVVFDKPGLVRLRCGIHKFMHAVIVVLENPYFAVSDADGRFRIPKVPAGAYRCYAFHEEYQAKGKAEDPLRVVGLDIVVSDSGSVELHFDLRRKPEGDAARFEVKRSGCIRRRRAPRG